jgi:hypothetical protein
LIGVESFWMRSGEEELLWRARQGAKRSLDELNRGAQDLSKPWPHVSADALAGGRAAVACAAEALRKLADQLDRSDPHP